MTNPLTPLAEQAVDAALAAWFGITKVMPERQILRERMAAAIVAHERFKCGHLCRHDAALGFIPEAGCPVHDELPTRDARWWSPPDSFGANWLTNGAALHPLTVNLVVRFARALAAKLAAAEVKYGYSDGWRSPDWMDECRAKLLEHVVKGDPRDVAAYCAFLWHHGASTSSPAEQVAPKVEPVLTMTDAAGDAFNNTFHKCRAEVSMAWWQRIWAQGAEWAWKHPKSAPESEAAGHHGLDNDRQVLFYEQDFYVLSNFSSFNLVWDGLTFATSEAAYHWEKFATEEDDVERNGIACRIMEAPSAHEAFKIAEQWRHLRRPDWDAVKVGIMRDILRAKADQHEYVRRKLLATGDRELIENSWRDEFWGWGPNRDGQNMLGKLWMEVRAELRGAAALQEGGAA